MAGEKMAMSRLSKLCLSQEPKCLRAFLVRAIVSRGAGERRGFATQPEASRSVEWRSLIQEAQNTVGYPTSYENLRWLLSDKFASVGLQLRKLAASQNTLHKTAK